MPKHPTVQVPNIGSMDHAWDLLGEWQTELVMPDIEAPVHGKVTFNSWKEAELELDPIEAVVAGVPARISMERASDVYLTDAGGGALQWVLYAAEQEWALQATMWPGSLHLFFHDANDEPQIEEPLYCARAIRDRDYYLRKYPVESR